MACFFAWRRQARATAAYVIAAGGYRDGFTPRARSAVGGAFTAAKAHAARAAEASVRWEAEGERGAIRRGAALTTR